MNRFDGRRFLQARAPKSVQLDWGSNQIALQDHLGDWWIASDNGLLRLDHRGPRLKTAYTTRDGLEGDHIFRVFEDSRGDIWTSSMLPSGNSLTRWERASGTFHRYSVADGLLPLRVNVVDAIAEDHAGNVWFGFFQGGGLLRYCGGRFTAFGPPDGVPQSSIRSFYCSRSGRLWAASNHSGLVRIDDPAAERPHFITYTTSHGLASNQIHSITEDLTGRIYAGTGRGVDRLDPSASGAMRIQHYTSSDGLAPGELHLALRDSQGALWFGTAHGLSRLLPEPSHTSAPPPVTLQALRIAGVPYVISDLGTTSIEGLTLAPYQNQIQVDFVAVTFASGGSVRYRYKLEGADKEWGAPAAVRSVKFGKLSPGRYRFLVQSVNSEGVASLLPAVVSFVLLPPFWQRWWFLTLTSLATAALVTAVYRYRVSHLLELERIRTRIAIDLHDDIGASLSQIAILSEVAQHRSRQSDVGQSLERIGGISRELVDSMGDIVWAIHPHKDRLRDLRQRMRRFAADVLSARNIEMHWHADDAQPDVELGPELRRQLYLIFKESVNNIVRHSGASQATIGLRIEHGWLTFEATDNGVGFDLLRFADGHGLKSMRLRGTQLGGIVEVRSVPGAGTTVSLRLRMRNWSAQ
jgi:two-component sensor histidine kinase